jgi:hypothetical protein
MSGLFGSAILEVAVGMIFVYLLVSLVVSAASELIAAMLKWRGEHLWKGISNLLRDPKDPASKKDANYAPLARVLYDHPLIMRLAQPGKKPSYIPSRTFALVLLDIVSNPTKYIKAELLKLTAGIGDDDLRKRTEDKIGMILDSGKPMAELKTGLKGVISALPDSGAKTKLNELMDKIPSDATGVGGLINAFPNDDVKRMLRVLWEESGRNVEKLKENVEVWFNNAMDRVSGWYKRKSQLTNFIIAIVIATWLNIDSEAIARRLSTDSTLRTALAAQAAEYAKQASDKVAQPAQPAAGAGQQAPGGQPQAADASEQTARDEFEERKKAVNDSIDEIQNLGLPIGWLDPEKEKKKAEERAKEGRATPVIDSGLPVWPGWPLNKQALEGWGKLLPVHGFGWLFTAIAASLGAPFWFDMLNKIITIRSSGKAPEEKPKSPKEETKPLGPGETPEEKRAAKK